MVDVYSVSDSIGLRTKIIIFLVLLILPVLFTSAYIPINNYAENDCIVVDRVIGKMVFPLNQTKVTPIKKSDLGTNNRYFAADWPFWGAIGLYSTSKHGPVLLRQKAKPHEQLTLLEYNGKKCVIHFNHILLPSNTKTNSL